MAWRDANSCSFCSRNDSFSKGAYLCLSDNYRDESSPASGLTVIKYRLVIPENFFQIGLTLAGDCLAYLNLYLLTTQKLLEVLQ